VSEPLLVVENLSVIHPARGAATAVTALDGVSLRLERGEVLALAGDSGSGKSTLARAILGLVPTARGSVRIDGREVIGADPASLRQIRAGAQMVFQDSGEALNPRMRIGDSIGEPLEAYGRAYGAEATEIISRLLVLVGLDPTDARAYPAQLSGGQRQRVGIARALALDPALILWDEAVSALDGPVRAQVLSLILDLQRTRRLASLLISHDLTVVRHVADRVAVMQGGRIVETGPCDRLFSAPQHAATRRLIAAMPG